VSGEAAEAIEKVPAGEAVAEAMTVLRGIFEPQGISVPTPLQVNHFTHHSHSSKSYPLSLHKIHITKRRCTMVAQCSMPRKAGFTASVISAKDRSLVMEYNLWSASALVTGCMQPVACMFIHCFVA